MSTWAISSRLFRLADEMADVAALMLAEGRRDTVPPSTGDAMLAHAEELSGAALLAAEWAREIGADPSPSTSEAA